MTITNSSISYLPRTGHIYIETEYMVDDLLDEIPIENAVKHYGDKRLLEYISDDVICEYVKDWSFDDAKSE